MAFEVDTNGNITLVQGDSGRLIVQNIPTDKNYTVYFAMQDSSRRPIGTEVAVSTNGSSSVVIEIIAALTDQLLVRSGEESAEYYYGIKLCTDEGLEDTLLLGDSAMGDVNTLTVYPKKVEGC